MENDLTQELVNSIKELQTQVLYLENKINTLIAKNGRDAGYVQGGASFDKPKRYVGKRVGSSSPRPSRPYNSKDRDREEEGEYTTKKKTYGASSEKKYGSKSGGKKKTGGKKKPGAYKGKR